MNIRIAPHALCGTVTPPSSKSHLHRALICALLSDRPTVIEFHGPLCDDVLATAKALKSFGAGIDCGEDSLTVHPAARFSASASVDCGESGSTLRLLLPVAAALNIGTVFSMNGRLSCRPVDELLKALEEGGCTVGHLPDGVLSVKGRLRSGDYVLPGNISSQYISGMLLSLSSLEGKSLLKVTGEIVSEPYIAMTLDMLRSFGAHIEQITNTYHIYGRHPLASPGKIHIRPDVSAAAFWHCAAAAEGNSIRTDIDNSGEQGDGCAPRLIREICSGTREQIDLADIPDLAAPLASFAAATNRHLTLSNASRLRLKESDRIRSITDMIVSLGGRAIASENSIEILSAGKLRGGYVDSCGDHRIAMATAIAACSCEGEVIIKNAECVRKSYPAFFEDYERLGGQITWMEA